MSADALPAPEGPRGLLFYAGHLLAEVRRDGLTPDNSQAIDVLLMLVTEEIGPPPVRPALAH